MAFKPAHSINIYFAICCSHSSRSLPNECVSINVAVSTLIIKWFEHFEVNQINNPCMQSERRCCSPGAQEINPGSNAILPQIPHHNSVPWDKLEGNPNEGIILESKIKPPVAGAISPFDRSRFMLKASVWLERWTASHWRNAVHDDSAPLTKVYKLHAPYYLFLSPSLCGRVFANDRRKKLK